MKTYVFRVVVESEDGRWSAYCPALERYGAATWGDTEDEAFKNIREVVEMIVEELVEENSPLPEGPSDEAVVSARAASGGNPVACPCRGVRCVASPRAM